MAFWLLWEIVLNYSITLACDPQKAVTEDQRNAVSFNAFSVFQVLPAHQDTSHQRY